MIEYPPKTQEPCGACGGALTRSGDCETCDGEGTGCDDLRCAHDHCLRCGTLLDTCNCLPEEVEHADEPHPTVHGHCTDCGRRLESHTDGESP